MNNNQINPRLLVLLLIIALGALVRLVNAAEPSAISVFTPIGAMGLFGGAHFSNRWKAYLFPLLALLLSDLAVNLIIFKGQYGVMYAGWYGVYAIFALIVFIWQSMLKKVSFKNILLAAVVASLTHWILSDLMSFFSPYSLDLRTGKPFTKDLDGLIQCYWQALPYLRNFFAGTLVYSALMFGAFELAKRRFPALAFEKVTA